MNLWKKYAWRAWGWCAIVVLGSSAARAALVLDQIFDPTGHVTVNAGIGGINVHQERAQTFKIGVSGVLTRVDVFSKVFAPATGSLLMDVRGTVAGGAPDPAITPLGVVSSASVAATSMPGGNGGFVTFTLDTPLPVTAGTTLAFDLHATAGASTFGLLGSTGDPYPFGRAFERVTTNHNWGSESNYDLGFRTFVDSPGDVTSVPLPAALGPGVVMAIGVLAVRFRSARRPRATP
jgi:hypothetical protein